ncbi:MAG: helix-turn-helix domain-containing protein [Patescibacteria group bacterium]|jgi:cytoskeletal protein RodZ|nr:helix-turn-helix domain-containing protein [bacterium]HQC49937.1 helix-turn-helix domain-containing protein [bacterium]
MNSFVPKKIITEDSWGEELRRARNFKNLSLETVAEKLKIRREYLLALETEDLDLLPAGLYAKNYLKKYAEFLEVDLSSHPSLLSDLQDELKSTDPFSQKILKKSRLRVFPKIIRNIIISLAIIICFLYLIFYFNKIILPPKLTLLQPDSDLSVQESSLMVIGQTEKEAEIKINGELILSDTNGEFSKLVDLKKGVNTIEVSAKKKYSRENIIIRQILVE